MQEEIDISESMDSCVEGGPEEARLEVGTCVRYLLYDEVLRTKDSDSEDKKHQEIMGVELTRRMIKEPRITPGVCQ